VALAQGVSREAVAYAWIMAHPAGAIPIVGSQRPERIALAAEAFQVDLSRTQWYAILVAARGEALP
jgi:predicted oxidoreductase